ncbi:MAG: protein kinase [Desulfomonilaceae bacterium]|nr:protein kinase [Desulfomonilaceae bacterium]
MERDAHSLREELYRVIQHYTELAQLATKGEVDPLSQIGRIIKKTAPYILLVIRDLLPPLERGELTYYEVIYNVIRSAQQFPDQQVLIDSRNEMQEIEEGERVFLYAVKWLDSHIYLRPAPHEIDTIQNKLNDLNEKYKQRYGHSDEQTTTLIPCFFVRNEADSSETNIIRMADLVRRAVLEMHHLMLEYEPERRFIFFNSSSRTEMEEEIMQLAWFLFRCGYAVDRIASGYYKDLLADFLNEKILEHLIESQDTVDTLQGLSSHLWLLSLMDFASFFEMPNDYIGLDDYREATRYAKSLKSKHRRGAAVLKSMVDLLKLYEAHPQGRIVQNFLLYRYNSAFGSYHGENRVTDPRGAHAVKLYKARLDREAMEKRAEQDLNQAGSGYSTKTRDEMAGLIKLIVESLAEPGKVRGRKLKVLGDISSGAMGKVSIGIFKNRIVALKRVKSQVTSSLGDPVSLLQYEAAIHARVQSPEQHPYVVEYFGIDEQDGEKLLINGYHPTDNLTQLVERNWLVKYKPPFNTESKLDLATMETIINQLLECLRLFRAKGVVHRDLKTDNVLYMVDQQEKLCQIKVIDFGVGMALGQGATDDLFKGKVVGTFSYMAPEQARGKSVFQSDLYSVGAIFTVLLTGKLPMLFPKTRSRQELVKQIYRIEKEPRPKLTALNPYLKKDTTLEHVAATVERMLDLDPMRRPNLEEVQSAFDGVFQHIGDKKYNLSVFYHRV